MQIKSNSVKCNHCLAVLTSVKKNEPSICNCGKVVIDGGYVELGRLCESPEEFTDLSVIRHKNGSDYLITDLKEVTERYELSKL